MAKKKAVKVDLNGTVVQLTKEQGMILSSIINEVNSLEVGMGVLSNRIRWRKDKLWELIFDFRPDLEEYHCTYNKDKNEVGVVYKKRTREKT